MKTRTKIAWSVAAVLAIVGGVFGFKKYKAAKAEVPAEEPAAEPAAEPAE